MKHLVKYEKILNIGFRASLNFQNMIIMCSPIIGQLSETTIVALSDKSGYNDPSKSRSRKVLKTVLSHL